MSVKKFSMVTLYFLRSSAKKWIDQRFRNQTQLLSSAVGEAKKAAKDAVKDAVNSAAEEAAVSAVTSASEKLEGSETGAGLAQWFAFGLGLATLVSMKC